MNMNGKNTLSIDKISLFTNISLTETARNICKQLLEKTTEILISTGNIAEPLMECNMKAYFMFNNEHYR